MTGALIVSNALTSPRRKAESEAKWLRNAALARYLGVSKMALWNWQHDPGMGFPQPTRINDISYTDMDEINKWMKERVVDLAAAGRKAKR
jgi:predicted DNA-binding transcriptional regulator AlpA